MTNKLFQKRIDPNLLQEATKLYEELGTTVGDAFVMFLSASIRAKGLPFVLNKSEIDEKKERAFKVDSLQEVKKLAIPIFEKYNIDKVELFGSFARGDFNENSDVDFVIISDDYKWLGIDQELTDILGRKVDVVDEESLRNATNPIGKYTYENYKKERLLIYEK